MSRFVILIGLVVVMAMPASGQGTLIDVMVPSQAIDDTIAVGIYLPQGYDPGGQQSYPVVYFLHGTGYSYPIYWTYFQMKASLDNLIGTGAIEPVIVVTPDGLCEPYDGSWWTNSALYGNYEDFVVQELVDYIDSNYRTLPTRSFRSLQGLSMGGYGAMMMGFKHSDMYRAIASHSGVPSLIVYGFSEERRQAILAEYPAGPPYHYAPTAGPRSLAAFTQAGAWSPNLSNPPYFVDFQLDEYGNYVDSVMARWCRHDPCYLTAYLPPWPLWPPEDDLDIFFDCGINDVWHFPCNEAGADSFAALGLPYDYRTFIGAHSDSFPKRFRVGIAHLDSVMWGKGPYFSAAQPAPCSNRLLPTMWAPSPSRGGITISYELPTSTHAELSIYDNTGRLVRHLAELSAVAGVRSASWRANDCSGMPVPAGVYYVRLASDGYPTASKRVVLLR
jgi:S-formylglutathione hydrolase FrmB